MFKNTYQNGLLSIFYSCGSHPLAIWDMEVKNGHIKRLTDSEINSLVLEIVSTNVATTYITCPRQNQTLGIKLPFMVMIVKNLKRYFSFEIVILDDRNMKRRFRISNFQSTTKISPFCTTMPIGLSGSWNQIQFNLADFTRRAYGSQFVETLRVQVHANVRLRRIYFSERLYAEEDLPGDYRLYSLLDRKTKGKFQKKDATPPPASTPPPLSPAPVPIEEAVIPTQEVAPVPEVPVKIPKEKPAEIEEIPPEEAETAEEAPLQEETPAETPTELVSEAPSDGPGDETAMPATEPEGEVVEDAVAEGAVDEAPVEEPPAEE